MVTAGVFGRGFWLVAPAAILWNILPTVATAQAPGALSPVDLPCDQVGDTLRTAFGGLVLLAFGRAFEDFDWIDVPPTEADSKAKGEAFMAPFMPYLEALETRRIACGLPEIAPLFGPTSVGRSQGNEEKASENSQQTIGQIDAGDPPPEISENDNLIDEATVPLPRVGRGIPESPDRDGTGPPLTTSEKDEFLLAVQRCWNVPAELRDVQELHVTLAAELTAQGAVIAGSIRLIEPASPPDARFQQAYEAGRRALIRCSPYTDLPREKYARWRNIEVVFNPEGMVSW